MTLAASQRGVVRATLLVVLSACCFGSISPLTVVALKGGASLQAIQAWRYVTTAVLLMAFAAYRGRGASDAGASVGASRRLAPWYSPRVLLVAGGGQATVATLALLSLRWLPAATAAFLFYTFPAWVAIIAAIRGVEVIDRVRIVALLLSLAGIAAMIGTPSAESLSLPGIVVILGAALFYALFIPILNELQEGRRSLDVARAITVGGSTIFVVWALATGTLFAHLDFVTIAASVLQGVLSVGAFLGFLAGLSRLGSVRTAITSTVEPFWTTLVGVMVLSQPIGVGTLVGGAAIMAAVVLLQRPSVSFGGLDSSPSQTATTPVAPLPEDS